MPKRVGAKPPKKTPKKKSAPKKKRKPGRPKKQTRLHRGHGIREGIKHLYVVAGYPYSKLSKLFGIPKGTISGWAINDKWQEEREAIRAAADREHKDLARSFMVAEKLAIDERQRRFEELSARGAELIYSAVLPYFKEVADRGRVEDWAEYKRATDTLEKAMRAGRVSLGLPERGHDYARHIRTEYVNAIFSVIVEVVQTTISDPAAIRRVTGALRQVDLMDAVEQRIKKQIDE